MNKNTLLKYLMPMLAVAVVPQALAGNVNVADARRTACDYINQRVASGSFKAPRSLATGMLTLAHTEPSQAVAEANDYYAFNVPSGGWIIVAGEDRATPVLAYNDQGHLDFDRLPCTVKALLNGYKQEIEYLQTYEGDDLVRASVPKEFKTITVGPLITSTWGQEEPYDWQCPVQNGEYCVVGCVATAMAQVMNYWKYPESCDAVPSYYCYDLGRTLNALPATTFNYRLILDSYCHWNWDNSVLVQDTYTDAQAQEVAKLSRYCGQAVEMGYSPEGSGAYTSDQLQAMKDFGFRSTAKLYTRSSWWGGGNNYTTAEWETMIKDDLNAGCPILYSASDSYGSGGHAFICDGYRSDGMFHFNMGWYGTCDGWYASTALNMTHRDGDELAFNSGHEMILGILPPEGWEPTADLAEGDINGDGQVDVNDLNIIVNIMLGKEDANSYPGNADIDGKEGVDVGDVNTIINIMLGKTE